MSNKPDWAERLQRTFSRKYDQGVQDQLKTTIDLIYDLMRRKNFNDLTPKMALAILILVLKKENQTNREK